MAKFVDALDILEIADYNNRKIVLSTKDGKPLRITTPRMYMPFGVSGFTPEVGQTKYNIDFNDYFREALEALKPLAEDELVTLSDNRIEVTSKGNLFIRIICMCFDAYLQQQIKNTRFSRVI